MIETIKQKSRSKSKGENCNNNNKQLVLKKIEQQITIRVQCPQELKCEKKTKISK